ncbi:ATP-binding protein [Myxococcota bacterium]|nr:ATP-binding protein [Myxococcota bacterium]
MVSNATSKPLRAEVDLLSERSGGGDPGLERRLHGLRLARISLAIFSVVLVAMLESWSSGTGAIRSSELIAVAIAGLASSLALGLIPRKVRETRFCALANIITDTALVTGLVVFSGGTESPLTFLYVLVVVYGAMLFAGPGAVAAVVSCGLGYGVVLGNGVMSLGSPSLAAGQASLLLTMWAAHVGALTLAGALGRTLAVDLRRTGEALDRRTTDLEELLSLHERTVQSLMSGLLTTDSQGRVTSFNPEAERITGMPEVAALRRDVESIVPNLRAEVMNFVEVGAASRTRFRMTYRNLRGEDLYLGVAAYALKDSPGLSGGYVVIFQDVTEVVAMEEDLRRSERMAAIGALSASLAHEIRNPLAAISGSLQLLEARLDEESVDTERRRLMEIIHRETDRLDALIGDFLHYARPGPVRFEPVPFGALLSDVLDVFEGARPADVTVEPEVSGEVQLWGDPQKLRQVVWNLLLNASQAMPNGGVVRIGARPIEVQGGWGSELGSPQGDTEEHRNAAVVEEFSEKSDWLEVVVSDDGAGIPADEMDRVFDPFFTTKKEGTGLGLATVHRIIEEHGGSVKVESTVGVGTRMCVRMRGIGGFH